MSGGKRKQLNIRVYGSQQNKRRTQDWSPFLDDTSDNMNNDASRQNNNNLAPPIPKRPISQKAATMASTPDQESISRVVEFTGCDRDLAVRFLKVKQNNIEAAVNSILENESIGDLESSTSWDESAFSMDRDGNETNLHALGSSPAPTRGPSPAPSLGLSQPKSQKEEDQDYHKALELSRQTMDEPFQQETGVMLKDGTETGHPKFGPATREHYESSQWAMVPASTITHEVVPDVDIEHRRNVDNEPRFLKHLPDGDYTPNFITICQAIPAAREAFILRDAVCSYYGYDAEWWRGHPIHMPRIVHTVDGSPAQPNSDVQEELLAETQRLMAFLDASVRSYATIGALTQTEAIRSSEASPSRSGTLLDLFINSWITAAQARSLHFEDVGRLFTTKIGTNLPERLAAPELNLVELAVNTQAGSKIDLFELLDSQLWDSDPDEAEGHEKYILRPAEIIIIRLYHTDQTSSQLGVQIPASIELDKYLKDNIAATRNVRQQIFKSKKRVTQLQKIENKLRYWPHPTNGTQIEARQMLQFTLDHYLERSKQQENTTDVAAAESRASHHADVAQKLQRTMTSIDQKLERLAQEKEKARKLIADLSKSTFSMFATENLRSRYTLRGVATKPNITYVLRPRDKSDGADTLLQSDEDSTPPDMQWWRIDYEVAGATSKIIKSKTADYDVLRAVELEHNTALLVYASDGACSTDLYEALPQPLQEFCQRDNDLFLTELQAEQSRPPAYDYPDVPRETIERTSMDSTRAEGGNSRAPSPPGYNDAGFDAHPQFGLGYDVKQVERADPLDPPVAEIKLSPEDEKDVEMVQRGGTPLFSGSNDVQMSGMESQDMSSEEPATKVENTKAKQT